MKKFITIFGQKENGKSTLAKMLKNALLDQAKLYATIDGFAAPIKTWIKEWFGFTLTQFDDWKNKDVPPPGMTVPIRYAATEGAKLARSINPNVFVDMMFRRLDQLTIIEDGRFENEAKQCKATGGYNIFICKPDKLVSPIEVPNMDESERWCGLVALDFRHIETPVCRENTNKQPIHTWVWNNSTLEYLNEFAQQLVYKLRHNYLTNQWDGK